MGRGRPPSSSLFGRRWTLPSIGELRLRAASLAHLQRLDATWPDHPERTAHCSHWRWSEIGTETTERYVVEGPGGECLLAWTARPRLIRLVDHACLRLEFLEVAPGRGSARLGTLAMALASVRSAEMGGRALALNAAPESAGFYTGIGALRGPFRGWKTTEDLVPFVVVGEAFERLLEFESGLRTPDQE